MPHSPLLQTIVCSETLHIGLVVVNFPPCTSNCIEPVGLYQEKEWRESQGDTQLSVVALAFPPFVAWEAT